MKEKVLGRTGLKVKTLGFGGIPIQRLSEEDAIEVVRHCYKLGLNYYDTARGYTTSEVRIGKALEDVREKVYLATKSNKRTAEGIKEELETSLKNLRTDYIDVYQLHNVSNQTQWDQVRAPGGALEAVNEAKEQGKIRHLSVTSHSPDMAIELVQSGIFETMMIPYNYLTVQPEEKLLPLCNKLNVGTVIMKPFGGGAFSNANTALKYVLSNPHSDIIIPGMLSIAEIEENYKVWMGDHSLREEEHKLIQQDKELLGDQFCRSCNYCQPCPQEIPISTILRTETQVLRRMGWSDNRVRMVKNAKEKLDTCIHCGECETRCPYNLPIQELLPKAMESLWDRMENRTIP
ncbi:MAG: aldo/keto reductase [Candidatus Bathyarchaeota archaeon]|nr:aldo/keto reductase [Candidatus Bathyarchaeota archaeon]